MVTATPQTMQRAINRARAHGGAQRVQPVAPNRYNVQGQHDNYSVTIRAHEWRCSCPAGVEEKMCWHLAAVQMMRLAQDSIRPVRHANAADLWGPETGCPDCGWQTGHRSNCQAVTAAS